MSTQTNKQTNNYWLTDLRVCSFSFLVCYISFSQKTNLAETGSCQFQPNRTTHSSIRDTTLASVTWDCWTRNISGPKWFNRMMNIKQKQNETKSHQLKWTLHIEPPDLVWRIKQLRGKPCLQSKLGALHWPAKAGQALAARRQGCRGKTSSLSDIWKMRETCFHSVGRTKDVPGGETGYKQAHRDTLKHRKASRQRPNRTTVPSCGVS